MNFRKTLRAVLKITSCILLILLLLISIWFFGVISLFATLGERTVVKTLYSPNDTYYAELIDDDQGALGGRTQVYVYDNKSKDSLQIYTGEWGEFEEMEIYWKDDNCLVISYRDYLEEFIIEF